jgi:hypothetical protein
MTKNLHGAYSLLLKNFTPFMECEDSLLCSQEIAIGPHPKPVHTLHPLSLRYTSILSSNLCLCLPNDSFLQDFIPKPCMSFSSLPHMLHALHDLIILIIFSKGVQIMKLFTVRFSLASCYFTLLRPKYSPQHPVFHS